MARAKVELVGAASHARADGTQMLRGQPKIITDAAAIDYYRSQAGFSVEVLPDEPAAQAAPQKTTSSKVEVPDEARPKRGFSKRAKSDDEEPEL